MSRAASSEGEFTEIPFSEEDDTSLRPTIVQLPNRSGSARHTAAAVPPPPAPAALDVIDPEILKELPPEIQQEILLEHAAAQKRATDAAIQAALEPSRESWFGSETYADERAPSGGDTIVDASPASGWACHVCTFMNHPQIPVCEICEAARPDVAGEAWWDEDAQATDGSRSRSGSTGGEKYSKLAQRIQSSILSSSLKKIKMPATPATTMMTQKDDPTAEDLLIAATMKIQQLQSSASQGIQSIMAKANAARRPSPLTGAPPAGNGPSPQATALLTSLQRDLNTKCVPGDDLYESLLVRLWTAIYQDAPRSPRKTGPVPLAPPLPRRPFERVSEGWVDIGFQGPNPDTDFRGGGLLALKCLVYVFEAYPHKMIDVVSAQKPSDTGRKWYPVCVAGVNLTCMIAGVLRLGNGQFKTCGEPYWTLFEEPSAFYQLYFRALVKMDAAWHRMNASFMEFGVVLKATRRMVAYMLDQVPQTLDELSDAAEKTFIDRFVVSVSKTFLDDTENGECPDPFNLLEDENEVLITSPRSALSAVISKLTGTASSSASAAAAQKS